MRFLSSGSGPVALSPLRGDLNPFIPTPPLRSLEYRPCRGRGIGGDFERGLSRLGTRSWEPWNTGPGERGRCPGLEARVGLAAGRAASRPAWGTRARAGPGGDSRSGWCSHVSRVSGSKQRSVSLGGPFSAGLALHQPPPPTSSFRWRRDGGVLNSLGTSTRPAEPVLRAGRSPAPRGALGACGPGFGREAGGLVRWTASREATWCSLALLGGRKHPLPSRGA